MTSAAKQSLRQKISVAHLALILPWVALVIDAWKPISDNSFLWHVRAGTLQTDLGAVLTEDPFSFTVGGEAWRTQSWLVELAYGWSERLMGLGFVPAMLLLVSGLTFLGIGVIAYRHSESVPATAFVLVLATLALISFVVPRPVLFSYMLMVLVIVAWDRPQLRWAVPLIFWIWAAVHASFAVGLAYIGLTLIMRRDWRSLPTAIAAGLATLFTAHGVGVIGFLTSFGENRDALQYLTEWRRPTLSEPAFLPFVGVLLFIAIGFVTRKVPWRSLWVVLPFALLGFSSLRAMPPALLALTPVVGLSLRDLSLGSRSGLRPRLAVVFAGVVVLLPFLLIEGSGLSEERFPLEAHQALGEGRLFHDDIVGGYLIWADGPDRKVYIDDRAELYGDRLGEFVRIRSGEQAWEPVFQRDGIEQALLGNDESLLGELEAAGWTVVYRDDSFSVLRP